MRDSVVQRGDDAVVQLLSHGAGRVHLSQHSETGGELRCINESHYGDEIELRKLTMPLRSSTAWGLLMASAKAL